MHRLLPVADLDALVATRDSWHQIAEHVVAKARFVVDGRVELQAFPGGFATPPGEGRRVRVDGVDIVVDDADGSRRSRLTTVADAAEFVGVNAGFPLELYAPATPLLPDSQLLVDRLSADVLGSWFAFTGEVLDRFAADQATADPSPVVLWPEHFDQAFFTNDANPAARANYGASPGDSGHPEPYLYVGPWEQPAQHEYWNATHFSGAVLSLSSVLAGHDPLAVALQFLRTGRDLVVP